MLDGLHVHLRIQLISQIHQSQHISTFATTKSGYKKANEVFPVTRVFYAISEIESDQ